MPGAGLPAAEQAGTFSLAYLLIREIRLGFKTNKPRLMGQQQIFTMNIKLEGETTNTFINFTLQRFFLKSVNIHINYIHVKL